MLHYKRLLWALMILAGVSVHAQQLSLGHSPFSLTKSAVLELNAEKQGLLLPRLADTTAINALNPPDGMVIFFTPSKHLMVRNNGYWSPLAPTSSLNNYWSATGNNGTAWNTSFLGTTNNVGLRFRTNNVQRFVVDSIGNVGIGESPLFTTGTHAEKFLVDVGNSSSHNAISAVGSRNGWLQVNVKNRSTGTLASSDFIAYADNGTSTDNYINMGIAGSQYNGNYFALPNDAYLYNKGQNLLVGTASAGKSLIFLTGGGSPTANERMRIDGNGNVGIGINSPTSKLYVQYNQASTIGGYQGLNVENTNAEAAMTLNPGSTGVNYSFVADDGLHGLRIFEESTERFRIAQTSGNVGIGNSSPSEKLDVSGNVRFSGSLMPNNSAGTSGQVLISNGLGNAPYWGPPSASTSEWSQGGNSVAALRNLGTTSNFDLPFVTNSSERMRLTTGGRLGIGTSSPGQTLDVNGDAGVQGSLYIDKAAANSGAVSAYSLVFGGTGSGEGIASKRTANGNQYGLDFYTASANRMVITNGGNVGIGTTSPSARLHVFGTDPLRLNGVQTGTSTVADSILTITGGLVRKLPVAVFQGQINGTGFVKASGTTLSYDNSTYVPTTTTVNGQALSGNITLTTSNISEGTNAYHTEDRVRSTVLTGFSTATATAVTASDNIVAGMGKLQGQINALPTSATATLRANNLSDLNNVGTARTNLGASTVGANFFTLSNPSSVTFPRINADNTVSALDAAGFRTAIGAGTGNGTVTSFSSGNLSPLFTTTVSNNSTTPSLSFSLTNANAATVFGNFSAAAGTPSYHAATADGQFLVRRSGALTFGTITAADVPTLNQNTTGSAGSVSGTNVITNANLRQSAGLSVLGNATSGTANLGDIAAANDGEVLRRSGTTLGFGTVATAGLANSAVTYAKIQNVSTNNRLLGRFSSGAGTVEEITVGTGLSLSAGTLAASGMWTTSGNAGTNSGSNFLGTTDHVSLRFRTGGTQRMVVDSFGRVGIGVTNPTNPLVVKDTLEIRRVSNVSNLLFTNTAGNGDFRIGGDGGDIFWQGGGGRNLQMGSYWGMVLAGDRQTSDFPAFLSNTTTNTGVLVHSQRTSSVPLAVQGISGQTANLTEWRNSANTVLNVVNASGNFGIGTTTPSSLLHVVGNNPLRLTGVQVGGTTNSDSLLTINNGVVQKIPASSYPSSTNTWGTSGNSGTTWTNNFIGSTDNVGFRIRTNNIQRMVVDSLGRIGLGTTAALSERLHVDGRAVIGTGTTALLRLSNQDNGNSADIFLSDANNLRISTNGSGSNGASVQLQHSGGSYSVSLEGIDASGTGNGTGFRYWSRTFSQERFRVTDGGSVVVWNDITPNTDATSSTVGADLGKSWARWKAVYAFNGTIQTSDARLKTNINPLTYGLNEVLAMQPVKYNWKHDKETVNKVGLIAQDVKKLIPEVVIGDEQKEHLGMNYAELVPVLINAIKEQQKEIETLRQQQAATQNTLREVEALKKDMKALLEVVNKLEKKQ